jgi:MFS family permease
VKPFHRLWLAQTISLLGDFVAVFAVQVAVTFRMHGGARQMTGVFLVSLIPSVLLGPFAGVFADRWNPCRTMIASDLARGLLILLLARAASFSQIYAICFAVSCASCFFAPAQSITIPLLVPRERLLAASAHMQQSMQLVRIASPAVASALAVHFGERACYYADSASFFFSAGVVATLAVSRPSAQRETSAALRDFRAGLHFLFTDAKFSFVVFSMAAGTFAAGCFAALASVYVRDVLHHGPSVLAMMSSLIGAGTIAGSAALSKLARDREPRVLIGAGMAGVGSSILLIAAIPNRAAALAGSVGMGLGVALVMVAATTMLQGETPPEMRGRVSAAAGSLASLAQLAAMLLSGACAAAIGIRGVFYLSTALLMATALSAACRPLKLLQGEMRLAEPDVTAPTIVHTTELAADIPTEISFQVKDKIAC